MIVVYTLSMVHSFPTLRRAGLRFEKVENRVLHVHRSAKSKVDFQEYGAPLTTSGAIMGRMLY